MSSILKIVSKAICVLLFLSFIMFCFDEGTHASDIQTTKARTALAQPKVVRDAKGREIHAKKSKIRIKIDEYNDKITAPVENAVAGKSPWVMRGVPFVVGILFYGVLLHLIANWLGTASREKVEPRSKDEAYTAGYR